jgi:hypothetical protein
MSNIRYRRIDTGCVCYSQCTSPRPEITSQIPSPNERRFESNHATSFCGGFTSPGSPASQSRCMIVPNQANINNIRFGSYSARLPHKYFFVPATKPLPNGSEQHGGLHYEANESFKRCGERPRSMGFKRSFFDKNKQIARVNQISKCITTDFDHLGRLKPSAKRKHILRENK